MTWDVIISGAGIIGVSLALELQHRGAQVLVLECGQPGKEASSAAAGMLAAGDPDTPERLRELAQESAGMYPEFVERLQNASGIKVDFRHGAIALFRTATELSDHTPLSTTQLKQLEPAIDAHGNYAYWIASESCVDPVRLMQAALRSARVAGIEIREHTAVQRISSQKGQVEVAAGQERFLARAAVNCQGAWAGAPVRPRKGQMISLQPQNPALLKHAVHSPEVYLVPRSSGKIVVGATVEDAGYDKTVVTETVHELQRAAVQVVPELAAAPIIESWAGLRPGTPDDLPVLGRSETPGIFIASGHFRNGILLAPITAKIMADMIGGKASALDISAFTPSRFAPASAG